MKPSYPSKSALETHVQRLVRRFGPAVVQVFGVTPEGLPDPLGPGVILAVAGRHLLLTAAHVLDHQADSALYGGVDGGSLIQLEGDAYLSTPPKAGRDVDDTDVGFVDLSPGTVEQLGGGVLAVTDIDVDDRGRAEDVFVPMGYPDRKSKRKGTNVVSTLYKYTTLIRPELYEREKRSDALHMVLAFHRRTMRFEGRQQTAPHPRGMSGGPIFRMENVGTPLVSGVSIGSLVALVTDYSARNHVLMGPRISLVLAYVRQTLPELANHLPAPARFKPRFET